MDVRDPAAFAGGHIPNTLNIWKDCLPSYSGWFLNYEQPIIVVDENNSNIEDLKRYLIRLGYDNVYGYLSGGFPVWFKGSGDFELFTHGQFMICSRTWEKNLYLY